MNVWFRWLNDANLDADRLINRRKSPAIMLPADFHSGGSTHGQATREAIHGEGRFQEWAYDPGANSPEKDCPTLCAPTRRWRALRASGHATRVQNGAEHDTNHAHVHLRAWLQCDRTGF